MKHEQKLQTQMLWMGGSPCSGKTTIATRLAETYTLRVLHVDKAFEAHRQQITQSKHPMLHKWTTRTWNELWMQSVDVLLEEAITCYREQLTLLAKTLWSQMGRDKVLVEGTSLLPAIIAPLLSNISQGIWVVPTEQFQLAQYPRRGPWVEEVLSTCEQPDLAYQNWMQRDVLFGQWVLEETRRLGLACMVVDGNQTIAHNTRLVATHFGLEQTEEVNHETGHDQTAETQSR